MRPGAVVAVTGRSGSGKSTVCRHYAALGYPVLDADEAARAVVQPESDCLAALARQFGADIINEDGTLRRRELAQRAFATAQGTRILTDITHPAIVQHLLHGVRTAQQQGARLVFVDGAAILGEAFEPYCEAVVVVSAPPMQAQARIVQRDGVTPQAAQQRLDAQMPQAQMEARANYIIRNDQTEEALLAQADAVLQALLEKELHGKTNTASAQPPSKKE